MWTGPRRANGYGAFSLRHGQPALAHRYAWVLTFGPIPSGLFVLHTCDVRACVNPSHLFLGTHRDNMHDMARKGRAARGERHVSRVHPDRVPRGDRSGARLHPETRPRGERALHSRLAAGAVLEIRQRGKTGETISSLSRSFGVTRASIRDILRRKTWTHI
jgi:hypothetical protein